MLLPAQERDLDELAATLSALARRLGEPAAAAIALSQQDVTVLHVLMAEPERSVSRQQIVQSLGENFLLFPLRAAVDKPVDKY